MSELSFLNYSNLIPDLANRNKKDCEKFGDTKDLITFAAALRAKFIKNGWISDISDRLNKHSINRELFL